MAVSEDNVIYANFGTRKRVTKADETNRVVRSTSVLNSPATRIAGMVSRSTDSGRLSRGRQYARQGHVVGLDIRNGAVHAQVAGSQNEPFAVMIALPYRSSEDIAQVSELMARTPNALRDARDGLIPDAVLDILIAEEADDLRFSCSCPDYDHVCKHVVAMADKLAARLDADPMDTFAMRGLDAHRLEQTIADSAAVAAQDSYSANSTLSDSERSQLFWQGREMPALPEPKVAPALEDSDMDLLRKAMRSVSHTNIDLLRAVSDIEDLYDHLTT